MTADEIAAMQPSVEAFGLAVTMELHCSLSSTTIAKARDIDETFVPFRATITALTAELAIERQARAQLQDKCEGMAEQAEADRIKIEAQADDLKRLRGVLRHIVDYINEPEASPTVNSFRGDLKFLKRISRAALETKP